MLWKNMYLSNASFTKNTAESEILDEEYVSGGRYTQGTIQKNHSYFNDLSAVNERTWYMCLIEGFLNDPSFNVMHC